VLQEKLNLTIERLVKNGYERKQLEVIARKPLVIEEAQARLIENKDVAYLGAIGMLKKEICNKCQELTLVYALKEKQTLLYFYCDNCQKYSFNFEIPAYKKLLFALKEKVTTNQSRISRTTTHIRRRQREQQLQTPLSIEAIQDPPM